MSVSQTLRRWTEGATCSAGRPSRCALAHILVFRLHRRTTYIGAACCYRRSNVICRSVCRTVTIVSHAKASEVLRTDRDVVSRLWYWLGWAQGSLCFDGRTLVQPTEYDWTVHVRRRCSRFVKLLRFSELQSLASLFLLSLLLLSLYRAIAHAKRSPQINLEPLGERCKLPQRGPRQEAHFCFCPKTSLSSDTNSFELVV